MLLSEEAKRLLRVMVLSLRTVKQLTMRVLLWPGFAGSADAVLGRFAQLGEDSPCSRRCNSLESSMQRDLRGLLQSKELEAAGGAHSAAVKAQGPVEAGKCHSCASPWQAFRTCLDAQPEQATALDYHQKPSLCLLSI